MGSVSLSMRTRGRDSLSIRALSGFPTSREIRKARPPGIPPRSRAWEIPATALTIPRALNLHEREEGHGKLSRARRGTFDKKALSRPWFLTLAAIGEQDQVLYIRKSDNKAFYKAYSLYISTANSLIFSLNTQERESLPPDLNRYSFSAHPLLRGHPVTPRTKGLRP